MLTKDQIIEGFNQLSPDERDVVLDELIRQIDVNDTAGGDVLRPEDPEGWTAEIDRRLERFRQGESVARTWPEVNARLEHLLEDLGEEASGEK